MAALYLGKANHQVTQKHKKQKAQKAEGTAHLVRVQAMCSSFSTIPIQRNPKSMNKNLQNF